MSITNLRLFDKQGFTRIDPWCLYVAFAPVGKNETYIKVGISQSPLQRIYSVHCGSPMPVQAAMWTHVGSKGTALSAERRIKNRLAEYRCRGEWFQMDLTSAEHKAKFHAVCKASFMQATGRRLEWKKTNIESIQTVLRVPGVGTIQKV